MVVKYRRLKNANGELFRLPLLSVRLACNKKHQNFFALIDSGAEICMFNQSVAEELDIDVPSGKPIGIVGIADSQTFTGYVHQIHLTVNELGGNGISLLAAFTQNEFPVLGVLGQRGFFDNHLVKFERYRGEIEIFHRSSRA